MRLTKLLRYLFLSVWFFLVPLVFAWVAVELVKSPEPIEPTGLIDRIRWFVRDQYVPALIVFFTGFEMLFYHLRHSLPLAGQLGVGPRSDVPPELRRDYERAQQLLEEAANIMKKHRRSIERTLPTEARQELLEALADLRQEVEKEPFAERTFGPALERAQELVSRWLKRWRKSELREYAESVLVAVGVALLLRAFVVEAFKIPSGSMLPTLQIQDHIFVNKLAYGPSIPYTRLRLWNGLPPDYGDVMVFEFPDPNPGAPRQDFIKRVIAREGDTLLVESGHPVINGWRVPSCPVGPYEFIEGDELGRSRGHLLLDQPYRKRGQLAVEFLGDYAYLTLYEDDQPSEEAQGPYQVKPAEVWVLGDNRNNSSDSRAWNGGRGGGVPYQLIKGRAMFVWMSFWPDGGINTSRILHQVMGKPALPKGAPEPVLRGIERCLSQRPAVTRPPPPTRPL